MTIVPLRFAPFDNDNTNTNTLQPKGSAVRSPAMREHKSPENPKVTIIEPDPGIVKEAREMEMHKQELYGELLDLRLQAPYIETRLDELNNTIVALQDRKEELEAELDSIQARMVELEQLLGKGHI